MVCRLAEMQNLFLLEVRIQFQSCISLLVRAQEKIEPKKLFRNFWGRPKDMMPPSWALGAHGWVAPPPGSVSGSGKVSKLLYANWLHDTMSQ